MSNRHFDAVICQLKQKVQKFSQSNPSNNMEAIQSTWIKVFAKLFFASIFAIRFRQLGVVYYAGAFVHRRDSVLCKRNCPPTGLSLVLKRILNRSTLDDRKIICKSFVRNYWAGISCKILARILQDCKKNAYLARNLRKIVNLARSCTENAFACKTILQDLVRNKFWVVQGSNKTNKF